MDLGLRDKVAVITGGSIGIGLAVAKGFAAEGTHVVLAARNAERLEAARAEIVAAHPVTVLAVDCDVSTAVGCDRVIAATEEAFGGADILVNNAGTGSNETIMEAPDDKWQFYWDLHVMAAVRLARGLVPSMKRRGNCPMTVCRRSSGGGSGHGSSAHRRPRMPSARGRSFTWHSCAVSIRRLWNSGPVATS